MNENTKGSSELRSDRDHLQQQFNEKVIETEELRKSRDQLIKRIKMKDKKLQVSYQNSKTFRLIDCHLTLFLLCNYPSSENI